MALGTSAGRRSYLVLVYGSRYQMTKLGLSYTAKPSRGRAAEESLAHGGEVMQLGAPFH